MPTRLLKIIDLGREVCLHTSDIENTDYAALSYCWGSTPAITLNSHNYARLKGGIRTKELPQTFQDAIWLTYQLKIPFIWIDSLCIVQDSPGDWTQESAKMHYIYSNASLTIAASRAANSSEGFLGNRVEKSYLSISFDYRGISDEVLAFPLPLNCVGDPKRSVWIENEPLTTRGWALQERYMSTRTLHFTSDRIIFENDQKCLLEDMDPAQELPSMSMSYDHFKNIDKKTWFLDWYGLVENYSKRKLTIMGDKLPALSGLAAHFSQHRGLECDNKTFSGQYLAGLWSDDIIRALCWRSYRGFRTPNYCAPTWSWASLEGRIEYRSKWPRTGTLNELADVTGFQVDLESPKSVFGKVLGGWLSLKVFKWRPSTKDEAGNRNLWLNEDGTVFRVGFSCDLDSYDACQQRDSLKSMVSGRDLVVVPLGWGADDRLDQNNPDWLIGPFCLILEAISYSILGYEGIPTFQRVGSGMVIHSIGDKKGVTRQALKQLITEKWVVMKQQGKLEDIIII